MASQTETTGAAIVVAATFAVQRPSDCQRAGCSGGVVNVNGQPVSTCGLAGCKHNWNPTHGGCGTDYPQVPTADTHTGRHTKRVRRLPGGEIGITLGDIEYAMPASEANELVGLINRARHQEPSP